jgi:YD repeat-containing protein
MGNLDYMEDTHGNRLQVSYDDRGRIATVSDPSGRSLNYFYEASGSTFDGFVGGQNDAQLVSACLEPGQFNRIRSCFGKTQFRQRWRITRIEGPGGLVLSYSYDADGNLATVTRNEGVGAISVATPDTVWEYQYGPEASPALEQEVVHLLASVKNPNGRVTNIEYELAHPDHAVTAIRMPEGVSNTYAYVRSGPYVVEATVVDGKGNSTVYTIADGTATRRQVNGSNGQSSVWTMGYNDHGQLRLIMDPEGMVTQTDYDDRGNPHVTTLSGPNTEPSVTETDFHPTFAVPTRIKDPNGHVTTYTLNGLTGDVLTQTLPTGVSIRYSYYPNGDVATVTDQQGLVSTMTYDDYGNVATVRRETGQNNVESSLLYDVRSRLKTQSGTLVASAAYTYDAMDRPVLVTENDPTGIRAQFSKSTTYYAAGQQHVVTVEGGGQRLETEYGIDSLDRVTTVTERPSGAPAYTRTFGYDLNSNILTEVDRRDVTKTNTYNHLNHLTSVSVSGPHGASKLVSVIVPDSTGNPTSLTDLFSQTTVIHYDGLHRPIRRTALRIRGTDGL